MRRTKDEDHKKELENLHNPNAKKGEKPMVYAINRDTYLGSISTLVQNLQKTEKKIAIIARTNHQVMDIAKELKEKGVNCSSTHFSASEEAKEQIIMFLRGILSVDKDEMKQVLFTPFFPIPLQKAFAIVQDRYMEADKLLKLCPELKSMRESVRTIEDVNTLFRETILPVCMAYGKEYLYAGITLQNAFSESLGVLSGRPLEDYVHYLESSDMLANESDTEKQVAVTTIHKSKGMEYDCVIYVPSRTNDKSNFQDMVVEGILKSHGINADEETMRVNFVAFTRAKKKLYILTDKVQEYASEFADSGEIEGVESSDEDTFDEKNKRAYSLFVGGDFDNAKKLLSSKEEWLNSFVKAHFDSIEKLSFSYITDDAYEYFTSQILNIREGSSALDLGSNVHSIAESMVKGEKVEVEAELKTYSNNIQVIIDQITKNYPEVVGTEINIQVPLSEVFETTEEIIFKGKIDAVFKNKDNYLIVDWKTSIDSGYGSGYRQQLEVYRRAFSSKQGTPLENIQVAIAYVGLRGRINTGTIGLELDSKQPAKSAYDTINKKVQQMLGWKKDVNAFFRDFVETQEGGPLWRSVVEIIGSNEIKIVTKGDDNDAPQAKIKIQAN